MPRKGENIRKRSDGRWEGRYAVTDFCSGKKKYCSIYAKTYTDVKNRLLLAKQNELTKSYGGMGTASGHLDAEILFDTIASAWLLELRRRSKHSTYIKYGTIYKQHIAPYFSDSKVCAIDSEQIKYFKDTFSNESESMIKSIISVFNQIIDYALDAHNIVLPKIKRKNKGNASKPIEVLKPSDQRKLLNVLYDDMDLNKLGIVICLFTGLRLGEICSLKWTDIDKEAKLLYISRTVQRIAVDGHDTKTMLLETEPKSIFSKRAIPLSDELLKVIDKFSTDSEYIISGNKPLEPRTYQNRFKKLLVLAGAPESNFHILRHTFATNCIGSGTDVKSLSEILGHSDVNITLNRYVHPSIETKRQHLNELSSVYGQYLGQK